MSLHLSDEEAATLAGQVIVDGFTKFMEDLNTNQAVVDNGAVQEFEFFLDEEDLDKVSDFVDSATVTLDVAWPQLIDKVRASLVEAVTG